MILKSFNDCSKWDKRFVNITNEIATWSSCLRRNVGAIIVKDKRIVATGYNGAPEGFNSCCDLNKCARANIESGTYQELCRGIHAEQNAIIQAAKLGISIKCSTIYCTHKPCSTCVKLIINSGIMRLVYWNDYPDEYADKLIEEAEFSHRILVKKIDMNNSVENVSNESNTCDECVIDMSTESNIRDDCVIDFYDEIDRAEKIAHESSNKNRKDEPIYTGFLGII